MGRKENLLPDEAQRGKRALCPRKEAILAAVVEAYIEQAAPVGSRMVVKQGVKLSPATVRSEMSELESLGLLEQPHTSAGRRPTNQGFRYYVEHLTPQRQLRLDDKAWLDSSCGQFWARASDIIAQMTSLLSTISHNVGMAMVIPVEQSPLTAIHFQLFGPQKIRVLFHLTDGTREERIITNEWNLDAMALNKLTNLVNCVAPGRTLTGLRRELLRQLEEASTKIYVLLARAVDISEQLIKERQPELVICGQSNLLDLPEFSEGPALRDLLRALEEKTILVDILEEISLVSGLRVIIGEENRFAQMHQCSIIASTYGREAVTAGTVGVIGPVRMDYARLIPLVHYTSTLLSECLGR